MGFSSPVALHDIRDVDAYIATVVRKLRLTLFADERAELHAEGLALLYELAGAWNGTGTFYGYASSLIDKRLLSAWHRIAGHSRRTTPTGERRWISPLVSLDAEREQPGFAETHLRQIAEFHLTPLC